MSKTKNETETQPRFPADHKPIVWIDVETLGLDVKEHPIVSVAMVITDYNLKVYDFFTSLMKPPEGWEGRIWEGHKDSGLINELQYALDVKEIHTMSYVEDQMVRMLDWWDIEKPPLGGSSVAFDREMLKEWMPGFAGRLHYHNINVSTILTLLRQWCPWAMEMALEKVPMDTHRAPSDIMRSIQVLDALRTHGLIGDNQLAAGDSAFEYQDG